MATTFVDNRGPTVLGAGHAQAVSHQHVVNMPTVVIQQAVLVREVDLRFRFFRFVRVVHHAAEAGMDHTGIIALGSVVAFHISCSGPRPSRPSREHLSHTLHTQELTGVVTRACEHAGHPGL